MKHVAMARETIKQHEDNLKSLAQVAAVAPESRLCSIAVTQCNEWRPRTLTHGSMLLHEPFIRSMHRVEISRKIAGSIQERDCHMYACR